MTMRWAAPRRPSAAIAWVLTGLLAATATAGCGTTRAGIQTLPAVTITAQPQLSVPVSSSGGTWAVVPMGKSGTNLFWELFVRPAGTALWVLVTPPGVADNGGLIAAAGSGQSLTAGFRPSQHLTFSPLAATGDAGRTWSALAAVLPDGLAASPDALAAGPGGKMLALTAAAGGTVYSSDGGRWAEFTTAPSLAHQPAVRACHVSRLTAVTITAAGTPIAGAWCRQPGTTGIFSWNGSSWQQAGPALPPALHAATVRVLRLTTTPAGTASVFAASAGTRSWIVGAWAGSALSGGAPAGGASAGGASAGGGPAGGGPAGGGPAGGGSAGGGSAGGGAQHWTLTTPLEIGPAQVLTAAPGPGGELSVLLRSAGTNRPELCQTQVSVWQCSATIPAGTATVVPGAGQTEALAVHGGQLTVWSATAGGHTWRVIQTIKVSIPYGSAG